LPGKGEKVQQFQNDGTKAEGGEKKEKGQKASPIPPIQNKEEDKW